MGLGFYFFCSLFQSDRLQIDPSGRALGGAIGWDERTVQVSDGFWTSNPRPRPYLLYMGGLRLGSDLALGHLLPNWPWVWSEISISERANREVDLNMEGRLGNAVV